MKMDWSAWRPSESIRLYEFKQTMNCCKSKLHCLKCIETIVGLFQEHASDQQGEEIGLELGSFLQFVYEAACAGSQDSVQVNAFAVSVLSGLIPKTPTLDFIYHNPAARDLFNNWLDKNPRDSYILKYLDYYTKQDLEDLQDKINYSKSKTPAQGKVNVSNSRRKKNKNKDIAPKSPKLKISLNTSNNVVNLANSSISNKTVSVSEEKIKTTRSLDVNSHDAINSCLARINTTATTLRICLPRTLPLPWTRIQPLSLINPMLTKLLK